ELVARVATFDPATLGAVQALQVQSAAFQLRRVGRDAGDLGLRVVVACGQVEAAVGQGPRVTANHVDTAGAGVHRVGEIAPARDPEDAPRLEELAYRVTGEVGREHDAVVDLDLIRVHGHVQALGRLQHQAEAVRERLLRLQRLGAQCAGDPAGRREGADL